MSREVRELPVLEGKAARDFYKKAANMKVTESKEERQEILRKTMEFCKEMDRLYPQKIW